jgi:hypothetical protein
MMLPPDPPAIQTPAPDQVAQPVRAIVTRTGDGVHVVLIGESARAIRVAYTLTAGGHGNRATQGGAARLEPGRRATLLDLTQHGGGDWSGVLEVRVDGYPAYRTALHAPG